MQNLVEGAGGVANKVHYGKYEGRYTAISILQALQLVAIISVSEGTGNKCMPQVEHILCFRLASLQNRTDKNKLKVLHKNIELSILFVISV